jgi:hypothetical protein
VREADLPLNAIDAAKQLAEKLQSRNREYALGGAIALGYWGSPRGTVDVDITVFMPTDRHTECLNLLHDIGCEFSAKKTGDSLSEHGFCRVTFSGRDVDVFLPTIAFYDAARARRKNVDLDGQSVAIWDAETLAVFKMMFFRRKDLADVEQIVRTQGPQFDRSWVRDQLMAMYGKRDPRLSSWDDLVHEVPTD